LRTSYNEQIYALITHSGRALDRSTYHASNLD
jgi:hypothetical protein